jgi:hypothetical protein
MPDPLLLYSTNTWLAYRINRDYYGDRHYVWCNRYFASQAVPGYGGVIPATASPYEVYRSLHAEVTSGDRHSAKISANRVGIKNGAALKQQAGVITPQQETDIMDIAEAADVRDFRPLMYLIPYSLVIALITVVPVAKRAHPMWMEYIIDSLPGDAFEIIELWGI